MASDPGNILSFWQGVEFLSPVDLPKLEPPKSNDSFAPQTYDLCQDDVLPWHPSSKRLFVDTPKRRWKHILYVGTMPRKTIHASLETWWDGQGADYAGMREGHLEQTALFAVVADNGGQIEAATLELAEFPWILGRLKPDRFSVPTVADWVCFKEQTKEKLTAVLTKQMSTCMQSVMQAARTYVRLAGWGPDEKQTSDAWIRCRSVALHINKKGNCEPLHTEFCGSFLSADLERARKSIEANKAGLALAAYLGARGSIDAQRVDVDENPGFVRRALSPQRLPISCWPATGKHPLVLGQQLAVNLAVQELSQREGVFSINGPPGTGKTTLVRDIVASVITERAEVLSQLRQPEDAFVTQQGKAASRTKPSYGLIDSLMGFEIVVASSNNSAVENVSRALPQSDAIDSSWAGTCDYFSDIATRIASARKPDADESESTASECWGHLAAVLGNSTNNQLFWSRFWAPDKEGAPNMRDLLSDLQMEPAQIKRAWKAAVDAFAAAKAKVAAQVKFLNEIELLLPKMQDKRNVHNLAECRLQDALRARSDAEQAHREQSQTVNALTRERSRAADGGRAMHAASVRNSLQESIDRHKLHLQRLTRELKQLTSDEAAVGDALRRCERHLADIQNDEERADKRKPWLFARWFRPSQWDAWVVDIKAIQQRLNVEREARLTFEKQRDDLTHRRRQTDGQKADVEADLARESTDISAAEEAFNASLTQAESAGFTPTERWEDITIAHVEAARAAFGELRERCTQAGRSLTEWVGRCSETQRQAAGAQAHAEHTGNDLREAEERIAEARRLMGANLPDESFWDLDDAERHLASPWAHEALHDARVAVFFAALDLHKAFILGARHKILKNIECLKDTLGRTNSADTTVWRALWSTFFLVTPLVSTTFASMGRLFAGLEEAAIGWLIVDEAGQATPQSPVGGLWRCRRALVVGDPMQLPPITTLDPEVLDRIGGRMGVGPAWNPSVQSAQLIADRASKHGAIVDVAAEQIWVGCPLRVHRRCLDPMFRVANAIAYEGRMVAPALPPPPPSVLGHTRWLDIESVELDSHYVPQEGFAALAMVERALAATPSGLPSLFVIAPFAHVKRRLKALLSNNLADSRARAWLSASVGTVHTFQGKEADAVLLVLGGHPDRLGAMRWASRTPNLLNVAITRARKHLYVIGDRSRWRNLEHYAFLARALPCEKLGGDSQGLQSAQTW